MWQKHAKQRNIPRKNADITIILIWAPVFGSVTI